MKKLKNWFNRLFIKQIFNSKKFYYALGSVIIPAIVTYLGVDEETATKLFYALISLVIGQGIADSSRK